MIIIGEKLNGFIPFVGKAIQTHDEAFIRDLARRQEAAGADYLDVCAGTDSETEAETLRWLVELAQDASVLPLSLDSANPDILAEMLPYCTRPGIINSVSLEQGKIERLFPLIAGTNWKATALLCSSAGVPERAEGRLALFDGILAAARPYGISDAQLLIDPVVHTLSTDELALSTFAECAREIKIRKPNIRVVSGLSNISFGLPSRPLINRAFLALAMQSGMDAAILDVLDRDLVGLLYATNALLGKDECCMDYITAYRENRIGPIRE